MTWDICRVCEGSCCTNIYLTGENGAAAHNDASMKTIAEHYPQFRLVDVDDNRWACDWYVDKRCSDYPNRPPFCSEFRCMNYERITDVGEMEGLI